jgi:glycosyltransferase involved in cell wall biosynthesis
MPRVSVIIPTYNDAHYLGEAIRSVLDQTYQDFEVIVVDDGSKDNPDAVVEAFGDPRIRNICQENKGLPGARNTGIKAAQGDFITLLDADDTFLPNKLEDQVAFLDAHPDIGLVAGGWISVDEQRNLFRISEPWQTWPELSVGAVLVECPLMVHCVLLRREALDQVGLFDESMKWQEDRDFWLRFAVTGRAMAWQDRIVCTRRWHAGNMSHNVAGMSDHALRALDNLYARADLPEEVLALKDRAYAARYAGNAAWYYCAAQYVEGAASVRRAVELDPKWLEGTPPKIIHWLVSVFANHPLVANRDRFLAGLAAHFPNIVPGAASDVRKEAARLYMADVFDAHKQRHYAVVRANLLKGIRYDPTWLLNIGVWSIGIQAISGLHLS